MERLRARRERERAGEIGRYRGLAGESVEEKEGELEMEGGQERKRGKERGPERERERQR